MSVTPRLDLRQAQNLVMTPQLQQAIKLLQMSHRDIEAFLAEEIEKNPLLDTDSQNAEKASETTDLTPNSQDGSLSEELGDNDFSSNPDETVLDRWAQEEGFSAPATTTSSKHGDPDDDDLSYLEGIAAGPSLREHLLGQIHVDFQDPADRLLAIALLDSLDDAGYLRIETSAILRQFNIPAAAFESVLKKLQQLDPSGVFARSLEECLAIQLREKNRLDPAMELLLGRLDLVAKRDLGALSKLCGVDTADITDMLAEIRALNPKPADRFTVDLAPTITPDIFLFPKADGGWHLELNHDNLPRLIANERYYTHVSTQTRNKQEKAFLSEKWQQANWLIKALHQRATTILKVAAEIVKQQDKFFLHGIQFLKPIGLRDVAAAIDMHESTVSRVTQNKYIATPRGTFELKYFFTTSIATTGGVENVSAMAVKARIKELIEAETPSAILSDDKLTVLLRKEGIAIARRTIAKYREALNIPPSSLRRFKK